MEEIMKGNWLKTNLFSLFGGVVFGIGFWIFIIIFSLFEYGDPVNWLIIIGFGILGFIWGMQNKYIVAGSVFMILLVEMLVILYPFLFKFLLSPQILELKIAIIFSEAAILGMVAAVIVKTRRERREKNGKSE